MFDRLGTSWFCPDFSFFVFQEQQDLELEKGILIVEIESIDVEERDAHDDGDEGGQ